MHHNTDKMFKVMLGAVMMTAAMACQDTKGTSDDSDVLVVVGNNTLRQADLSSAMPGGLNKDDSVKFARAYIRSWIDARLVSEIAAKEIDMTEIDKMVEQYRKELIMWEYSRRMYDSHRQIDIPEDTIASYYNAHAEEFVLKSPMVHGIYIKVADDAQSLPTLRQIYKSRDTDDLDKIEKTRLDGAVHFDYFLDTWIDWEQIETLIPYGEFGDSPDKFLDRQRSLDFSKDGFTYLLNITDVLHTGATMPYETARNYIIDRLTFHDMRAYDLMLKDKLYEKALSDGKIKVNCEL